MTQSQENETEIHDDQLKIPKIMSILSNNDSLIIKFVFVKQAKQSIDNAKNDGHGHGGHAHKHGDEVVTIRKELQFHEIETEIKCNNNNNNNNNDNEWISLGGFRRIHMLQKVHCHSDSNNSDCSNDHDSITLCYPIFEINEYLISSKLKWVNNGNKFAIRMRLRYKIAYRVAHLSEQIDSIISCFCKPYIIKIIDNDNDNDNDIDMENKEKIEKVSCLSLCSNKLIEIDNLSSSMKSREYLKFNDKIINYNNDWLFYPSINIGYISNNVLSSFESINNGQEIEEEKKENNNSSSSILFCYDGFNKDNEILCFCNALNLNNGIWYKLPLINNPRSRAALIYTTNTKQLLICGGYRYDIKDGGTKYLNSIEYLDLSGSNKNKLKWKNGLSMRVNRCEHSIGLISKYNNKCNKDMMLICGGSNDMFLRSSSILTVSNIDNNISFNYKRGGLMKEACIKGSICHDMINNNGDNIYIIGGNNGFGSTRNAQCFNLEKNKWSMINGTIYEHDDYPGVWIEKNKNSSFYRMIGVIGHSQQLSCIEYYDYRINKWIPHCQYPYFQENNNNQDQNTKLHISRMICWQSPECV